MISGLRIKNIVSSIMFRVLGNKEGAVKKRGCSFVLVMLLPLALFGSRALAQPISDEPIVGSAMAMTSLSNFPIGQNLDRKVSIRFKSDYTGTLTRFKLFWIYKNSSGYHAGDGGDIKITLRTDDNTANHNPSSSVLATTVFSPKLPYSNPTRVDVRFKEITFGSNPRLAKGQIYHLQFENIDPNKSSNWISLNSVYNHSRNASILQPAENTSEWALLNKIGSGGWQYTSGFCPILALGISTSGGSTPNVYQGNGYMEFWGAATNGVRVGGSSQLRQVFKATKSIRVGGASISAGRYGGTGSLKVDLISSNGAILDTGYISSGSFPYAYSSGSCPSKSSGERCHVWGYANFPKKPAIAAGQSYFLRVSASSGSDYRFNFPRDGSVMYGRPAGTVINGRAEKSNSNGSSWSGISYWGVSNRSDADMEFFLEAA